MTGRVRHAGWLITGLLVSSGGLAVARPWPTPAPIILPIVFVLLTMWMFGGYRTCGYHFTGQQPMRKPAWRWFLGGAGLAVAGISISAIALFDLRVEQAMRRPWMRVGILPRLDEGGQLTDATLFRSGIGMTRPGIEALQQSSIRRVVVECSASPEQIGWLLSLRNVDEITLMGSSVRDEHLKGLYEANHLVRLELYDTKATVAEVKKLQQALVNCEVRMTDSAGNVLVGPPGGKQKARIGVVRQ